MAKTLEFPQDYLEMNNIYLWGSSLQRHVEYQPGVHEGKTHGQSRRRLHVEFIDAESRDGAQVQLLRVNVEFGIRSVYDNDGEEILLHSLEATFAVEYRILVELPEEKMEDFVTKNCVHNVWPFWREHVYSTLKQASLPVLNVPFFAMTRREQPRAKALPTESAEARKSAKQASSKKRQTKKTS